MKITTITKTLAKAGLYCVLAAMAGGLALAQGQNLSLDFESPTYTSGSIVGQDFWVFSANQGTTNMQIRTATEITNILIANGMTSTNTTHGGTQAFLTTGNDASTTVLRVLSNNIIASAQVSFDFWAQPLLPAATTNGGQSLGNIFVTMEDTAGVRAAAVRFGFDSPSLLHIDYANGLLGSSVWTNSGMLWTSNTWYHIAFQVDYAAQTYDFFVNDTKLNTAPIPFYNNDNTTTFSRIAVVRGNKQAGMIVDDFNASSTATTAPTVRVGANNSRYAWKFSIPDFTSLTPDTNSITVKVDGTNVTPTSIVQTGNIGAGDGTGLTTVFFDSTTPIFNLNSSHTAEIKYTGSGFSPVDKTVTFTINQTQGTLDRVHHYFGSFVGAKYGSDGSGHTGAHGDYAVDMGNPPATNSRVLVTDGDFLNAARASVGNDVMSASIWVKRRTLASSSDFWFNSPTAPVSGRAFQLHCPYSDDNVYFDTGGGTAGTSRLSTNMTPVYPPSFWSNTWHHIVAVKNGGAKTVYIDGQVIVSQASGASTISGYNDLNLLTIGSASPNSLVVNGLIDDFSVYSTALTTNDVAELFAGTAPTAIDDAVSLIGWWDFNDAPDLKLAVDPTNSVVTFNQTLQISTNAAGPYVDLSSATSPYTNAVGTNTQLFFRARK